MYKKEQIKIFLLYTGHVFTLFYHVLCLYLSSFDNSIHPSSRIMRLVRTEKMVDLGVSVLREGELIFNLNEMLEYEIQRQHS